MLLLLSMLFLVLPPLEAVGGASGGELRGELEGMLAAGLVSPDLVITYDAMHPFHGGTVVEIRGDGVALRTSRRRGDQQSSIRQHQVRPNDVLALLDLLVVLRVWEQRVPERSPVPGEGRASVLIEFDGRQAGFWEWYNDMGEHDRLLRISALMTELVPR